MMIEDETEVFMKSDNPSDNLRKISSEAQKRKSTPAKGTYNPSTVGVLEQLASTSPRSNSGKWIPVPGQILGVRTGRESMIRLSSSRIKKQHSERLFKIIGFSTIASYSQGKFLTFFALVHLPESFAHAVIPTSTGQFLSSNVLFKTDPTSTCSLLL